MLRVQGEQAGESWSQLGVREVPGTQGYSGSKGSKLGARGVSWRHKYMAPCIYSSMCIWLHVHMAPCIYGSMRIWLHAYTAPCIYGSMHIQLHAYTAPCVYSTVHIRCSLPLLPACSPCSSSLSACSPISSFLPAHPLAPCHPEVVGIPIHTFIGHWEPARSELEGAGVSWK